MKFDSSFWCVGFCANIIHAFARHRCEFEKRRVETLVPVHEFQEIIFSISNENVIASLFRFGRKQNERWVSAHKTQEEQHKIIRRTKKKESNRCKVQLEPFQWPIANRAIHLFVRYGFLFDSFGCVFILISILHLLLFDAHTHTHTFTGHII